MLKVIKCFNSYFHLPVKKSKSGTGIIQNYEFKQDPKTGRIKKVHIGQTDVYKLIQENAKLCGIDLLVAQIKSGNLSGLDASGGLYADAKDLPKTIHDVHNLSSKALNTWSKNKILQKLYKTPDAYLTDLFDGKVKEKVDNFYNVEKSRLDAEIKKTREEALLKTKIDKVDNPKKEEVQIEPNKKSEVL